MKILKPACAAIGVFLALGGNAFADDKAEITKVLDNAVTDLTNCNVDKMSKYWSADGTIFPPSGTKLLTAAEEMDRWKKSCAAGEKVKMTVEDLKISVHGNLAVVTGLNPGTFTPKGAEPEQFTYRFTAVMKKEGGKWKQYQVNVSAPAEEAAGGEEE